MLEKSTPPVNLPITGISTSLTNEPMIFPKAPPMMIPTAMSMTLPFIANSLNSDTMLILFPPVKKTKTTPSHPSGGGAKKRLNASVASLAKRSQSSRSRY